MPEHQKKRVLNNLFSSKLSCCLSPLILLTFILESSWTNIFSSLSTFVLHLKYRVLLCCQLHFRVLSKYIADPTTSHIYEHSQRLSFELLTRQWYCSREAVTLLLLDFYLSGSKPLTEKSYVGFHLLVSFVTSFSSGYIYFVIMFSSFSADFITESPFYSDSFCLTLILTMNLSLGTSGENLKKSTVFFSWYMIFSEIRSPSYSSKWPKLYAVFVPRVIKLFM